MSSEQKTIWKCPDCCASQRRGGDNSSTPIRSSEENTSFRKKPDAVSDLNANVEVKELIGEVRLLTKEISSLKKQLENAISSLSSCEKRLDELGTAISNNDSRITQLESREQESNILKTTVKDLKQELNMQAQNYLRNELELSGIPERNNENLHHITLLTARKIGVELEDKDIDWVMRVGPRKNTNVIGDSIQYSRPVVVRLLRKAKRDEIIKAAKMRRNITSADYDFSGPSQKIFCNERLTKHNRELFREARSKSKQLGFAHCWCSQGVIFVRKHDGKPARSIRTLDDLSVIFSSPGCSN